MAYGTLKADSIVYDSSGSDVSVTVSNIVGSASPTFTGNLTINAQGDLRLADSDSSNYVGFQAPGTVSSNVLWTLPGADGSAGEQLTTDGSGTLSWSAAVNVAAASLTGTTMASGVVTSSLTTVGTLTGLTIDGDVTFTGASSNGTWDKSADAFVANLTGTASIATTVTVADESSDTTCFPLFATAATGNLGAKTGSNLTFNSATGILTAGGFTGDITGNVTGNASGSSGSCTGNAATATEATNVTVTANNSTDETVYPLFADGNTGTQGAETDTGLTYNPSSGKLTATEFVGNIDAVDGDFDGTLEADAITIGGTALGTVIAGTTVTNSTNAAHVSVADNESTDENNLIPFIEDASATGNVGLESDGDFHYNPSTGKVTATTFEDSKGDLRQIVQNTQGSSYTLVAADAGKHILASGTVTIPNSTFAAGDAVTIVNNTASDLTLTSNLTTTRNSGDDGNAPTKLKKYGMCTFVFVSPTVAFVSGAGLE